MLPDFLFLGPDKTGSTWLSHVLRSHPDCFVPELKDIYFFDRYYHRGLDWYERIFDAAPAGTRQVGEFSHDYFFSDEAADRIARDLPKAKLITCLRDPADRTYSQYMFMVRSGRTRTGFLQALQDFPELIQNSRYAEHLERYLSRVPAERVRIFYFEDLKLDAESFTRGILEYLELPWVSGLPLEERVMAASEPRSVLLSRLARAGVASGRSVGLTTVIGRLKSSPFLQKMLFKEYTEASRPRMQSDERAAVVEFLTEDGRRLAELVDRDVSGWYAVEA